MQIERESKSWSGNDMQQCNAVPLLIELSLYSGLLTILLYCIMLSSLLPYNNTK